MPQPNFASSTPQSAVFTAGGTPQATTGRKIIVDLQNRLIDWMDSMGRTRVFYYTAESEREGGVSNPHDTSLLPSNVHPLKADGSFGLNTATVLLAYARWRGDQDGIDALKDTITYKQVTYLTMQYAIHVAYPSLATPIVVAEDSVMPRYLLPSTSSSSTANPPATRNVTDLRSTTSFPVDDQVPVGMSRSAKIALTLVGLTIAGTAGWWVYKNVGKPAKRSRRKSTRR